MPALGTSPTNRDRAAESDVDAFAPEFRLLLACCRLDEDRASRIEAALHGTADWPRFLTLAEHHGVLPAVHESLGASLPGNCGSLIPELVHEQLRAHFVENARKSLRLTAELFHILDCLEQAGIEVIPYKGPVLTEQVYGDLARRIYSDLDLLVRAADVGRAKQALAKIGYVPNRAPSPLQERAYLQHGYEQTFDGPAGKNLLELQWNVVPRYFSVDFSVEQFFARAAQASLAGRTVQTLSAEDLFLALSVHAAKHLWVRLCWLRDLAALAASPSLQWELIETEAKALGVSRIVAVSLQLAQNLLGARLPQAHAERLADLRADSKLAVVSNEIALHMPKAEEYSTESFHYFRWMLRLRERSRDRLRLLARLTLTPSIGEWEAVTLPDALFPLYRGVRLARVAARLVGLRGK